MRTVVSAFVTGALFGLGIAISGMINPAKVLNFFDLAGTWDPSLVFVMAGGLATTFVGYRLIFGILSTPMFEGTFPESAGQIDRQLLGGAALFGIGWGIAGFCPGASIPALGLLYPDTAVFVAAVVAGIVLARFFRTRLPVASPV